VENLEIKVAFQEHCLSQLDEVIQALRLEVDMLKAETSSLKQELGALQPSPEDGPPPHW
jgi:uncharacterized coiled-coil protein SlyX